MGKDKGEGKRLDWLSVRRAFGYLTRLMPYLKPQCPQALFILLGASMYAAGFALRIPVVKPFVDLGLDVVNLSEDDARRVLETTIPLAGMLAAGAVLMALGTFLKQYFMGYVQARTRIRLQRAVVDRLLEQPISFFNAERKGALLSRATSNISAASTLIKIAVEDLFSHPITIFAILVTMVYTSPSLTLVVLVVCPIVLVPVILFAQKIKKASRKKYQGLENQGNFFHQMLDGIRVVKAFRMQDAQKEEFDRVSIDVFERERKIARYKGTARALVEITYNLVMAGIMVGVGFVFTTQWFEEAGGIGMFLQFVAASFLIYDPLRRMGHSVNEIQEATVGLDRVFEIYDRQPEIIDRPGAKDAPREFNEISIEGVSFQYVPERKVLHDVSFKVKRGEMIAFVGQSGMGKSTMMDLIPRFYDPVGGAIKVDGTDLRDLKADSWLSNIAMVTQETFLFNTTIRKNIMAGKPDATEEEVIAAAKAANVWDEIAAMPKGLDTLLGDRGVNLSGGQRQRVAIARAFLKKAPILLLDEATSNLDTRSEREVQRALDGLVAGCTVFVVAHRLSTIRRADRILVFHHGKIVESGSHDELLELNGHYATAVRLQKGDEPEDEQREAA